MSLAKRIDFGNTPTTIGSIATELYREFSSGFVAIEATTYLKGRFDGSYPSFPEEKGRLQFGDLYSMLVNYGYLRQELVEGARKNFKKYEWQKAPTGSFS